MILIIGEILFDHFPDGKKLGGAPFNFAFHLKELGFPLKFFSRVGMDEAGDEIHEFLADHKFDALNLQRDPDHATGTVMVELCGEAHEFTITENAAWDHMEFIPAMEKILKTAPDLLYFGTLLQRGSKGQALIETIMANKPQGTRVFSDINLRPGGDAPTVIQNTLNAADIVKMNKDELNQIWGLSMDHLNLEDQVRERMAEFNIDQVILTLGTEGSLWVTGDEACYSPVFTIHPIADTVGAGDAYAAICAAGLLENASLKRTMALAGEFAGRICTVPGAIPDIPGLYRRFQQRATRL